MITNNAADNPIFVFMTSKVTTKVYWKRLKNATTRWIYLLAEKKLTEYTRSVRNIKIKILEKKLNPLLSSFNRVNLSSSSTKPDLEKLKRNHNH